MLFCSNCGQSFFDNETFCPNCGQALSNLSITPADQLSKDSRANQTAPVQPQGPTPGLGPAQPQVPYPGSAPVQPQGPYQAPYPGQPQPPYQAPYPG
ncbi:MAG: hypothetical protein LBE80_05650, partial [Deltaproteobacteria bacterium]|nr:hypothetical protein [Deltaproteobacteria bacterium]